MNIYTIKLKEANKIILEKFVIDETKYTKEILTNGVIVLTKNLVKITKINDIKNYYFKNSTVISCSINNIQLTKLNYMSILYYIYNIIGCGTVIITKSILNIKTIEKNIKGFNYIENLGISVQSVDSDKSLTEILWQCFYNHININITIKLEDNNLLNITI